MSEIQAEGVKQNQGATHASALAANLKAASANSKKVERRVFRSNILTMRYVFKAGKVAPFLTKNGIDSEYSTDIAHEIEELDAEIAAGHPNITSKPEEVAQTVEPVEALKARHFAEFKALMAKTINGENDAGYSAQEKLVVANSKTVADGAASSDGSAAPAPALKISIGSPK